MALPQAKKPKARVQKKTSGSTKDGSVSLQKKQIPQQAFTTPVTLLQEKKSSWGRLWFIILLCIVILWWLYRDNLSSILTNTTIDTGKPLSWANNLFVGKDIVLTWSITRNTVTKYSYTHMLTTIDYGDLWLRSSSVNLYGLSWSVEVKWKIVDFSNNMYIVEVSGLGTGQHTQTGSDTLYFSTPGLLIKNLEKDGFEITQHNTTNTISLVNSSTNAKINIRYFVCSKEKTYDCAVFEESFKNSSGAQSVDSYDNIFYKLNDANTRFANLDDRYGIYIETSSAQLFPFVVEKSQFITNAWAKKYLSTPAKSVCVNNTLSLQEITSWSLAQTGNLMIWNIQGTDNNFENLSCIVTFDPEQIDTLSGQIVKGKQTPDPIIPEANTGSTTEQVVATSWSTTANLPSSSTPQFPLRPGKEMLFSTRGMTIAFPSPNISFSSTNIFDTVSGVKCSVKTNVVEYAKKDQVNSNPSVVLYFCANKPTSLTDTMRILSVGWTTILIEVKNPAWTNFANAITIQ